MLRLVRPLPFVVILLMMSLPATVLACLWDHDTIRSERHRFPGTLELITGKFLRHSPEFYRWRIENRLKRLESDPENAALLDDLAVAYDKVGEHDLAIATALRTETLRPGRYETAANLGTFTFHAGRLHEGLPHIERALAINPQAHFGREKYQKLLVEYVLKRRGGGPPKLPLAEVPAISPDFKSHYVRVEKTFPAFLDSATGKALTDEEQAAALRGVLGMMKFGKHDSPVLLEALGSLLLGRKYASQYSLDDGKLLAARAFLKASREVPDGPSRTAYRTMAVAALEMQTKSPGRDENADLEEIEELFAAELAEANRWYDDLRSRETEWIRTGRDPEAEFDRLYDDDPELTPSPDTRPILGLPGVLGWFGLAAGTVLALLIALSVFLTFLGFRSLVRRWRRAAASARDAGNQ